MAHDTKRIVRSGIYECSHLTRPAKMLHSIPIQPATGRCGGTMGDMMCFKAVPNLTECGSKKGLVPILALETLDWLVVRPAEN